MKAGKFAVILFTGAFMLLPAVAVLPAVQPASSVAYAARGGAHVSAPRTSAPRTAPSTSKPSTSNTQSKDYKPSQDAKSIPDKAPSAARTNTPNTTQSGSRWGNVMRNIGLFAGGMFLGSMLGQLFGMGGGLMSDILGLLMNVLIVCAVVFVLRKLWNHFRGSRRQHANPYASTMRPDRESSQRPINITPHSTQRDVSTASRQNMPAGRSEDGGYDPKRTADRYRSR